MIFYPGKILAEGGASTGTTAQMNFPSTLVLGATGRIGRVLRLTWPAQLPVMWQARAPQAGGNWAVFAPLDDPAALRRAASGRQILCLAGAVPSRSETLEDNSHLALAAIEAADPGQRVLLCSSAAVYGGSSGLLDETTKLRPANAYGQAKAAMETAATTRAAARGVRLCNLRIGNIAGLDAILGGWRPGFRLDHFADGSSPARSYIGVQTLADCLAGLLIAAELPLALNVAQPGATEMGALLDAAGYDWQAQSAGPGALRRVELNTALLQNLLGARALGPATASGLVAEWAALQARLNAKGA